MKVMTLKGFCYLLDNADLLKGQEIVKELQQIIAEMKAVDAGIAVEQKDVKSHIRQCVIDADLEILAAYMSDSLCEAITFAPHIQNIKVGSTIWSFTKEDRWV